MQVGLSSLLFKHHDNAYGSLAFWHLRHIIIVSVFKALINSYESHFKHALASCNKSIKHIWIAQIFFELSGKGTNAVYVIQLVLKSILGVLVGIPVLSIKYLKIYTFIGIHSHTKRMFFIMCTTKTKKNKTNAGKRDEATKTFQRRISVEGVNE